MSTTSQHGSAALTVDWNSAPAGCTNGADPAWTGVHHYEIYRRAGATYASGGGCGDNTTAFASSAPQASEQAGGATSSSVTFTDWVHRSAKDFRYQVVACMDGACTRQFGKSGYPLETVTSDEDYACTERETWVVEDVDDLDPAIWTNVTWIATGNASAALYYPPDFATGLVNVEDTLGVWFSAPCDSKEDCIYFMRATSSGTHNWNAYAYNGSFTTPVKVAEEVGGTGDFSTLSHPWVAASDDGTNQWIRMWMRRSDGTTNAGNHTVRVDSVDEVGADFMLECVSGTCDIDGDTCAVGDLCDYDDDCSDGGPGVVDLCADGTSSCAYLIGARHGRIMWDYVTDGPIDWSTHEPWMISTGAPEGGTTCADVATGQDDLYRSEWTGSAWEVVVDSTGNHCPTPQSGDPGDRHDPGIMPLPAGEFKMYHEEGQGTLYVAVWNPTEEDWEDETEIEVVLDDAMQTDVTHCVDNMDVIVHVDLPNVVEQMLFKARSEDGIGATGCFQASPTTMGILSSRHVN